MTTGIPFGFGATPTPNIDPDELRRLLQLAPLNQPDAPAAQPVADLNGPAGVLMHQPGARMTTTGQAAAAAGLAGPLFDPAPIGSPRGFSGTAGVTLPTDKVEVPLPPRRPAGLAFDALPEPTAPSRSDAPATFDEQLNQGPIGQGYNVDPKAIAPLRAGLIRRAPGTPVPLPGATAEAEPSAPTRSVPQADRPMPGAIPFGVPRPAASAAPAPASAATGAATAGATPAATAPAEEPGFWSRIGTGLQKMGENGLGDQLGALGAGLLSAPGAAGWAAGIRGMNEASQQYDRTKLLRQELGIRTQKAAQEAAGLKGNQAFIKAAFPDLTPDQVAAGASNSALVTASIAKMQNRNAGREMRADSNGVNRWVDTGESVFKDDDGKTDWQLVDVPLGGGRTQKQWVKKGEAAGVSVGQPASPTAPQVKIFELRDGTKVERQWDPATNTWSEPSYGANPPAAQAPSNPYATGKFNEGQGKAAGFSDRMMGSEQILRGLEGVNTTPVVSSIAGSQHFPNAFKTEDRQKLEQAQRDFVNAQLRRESGAAISPSEFANAEKQYFPQPGDGDAVIAQKRVNRQRAVEAMGRESGPAYAPSKKFDETGAIVPSMAPADRFKQLRGAGLSKADAYARMHSEGF